MHFYVFISHQKATFCCFFLLCVRKKKKSSIDFQTIKSQYHHTQWTLRACPGRQCCANSTTELSNIYCLVNVSVRNYDISRQRRSSSSAGTGGFPTFPPQTSTVWAWSTHRSVQERLPERWWMVRLRLIPFETQTAIKKERKKKNELTEKGFLKDVLVFLADRWYFVYQESGVIKPHWKLNLQTGIRLMK